eukprot:SAG25_NODE_6735_length_534_cov_0.714943_1_plen_83_part_10
MAAAAGSGSFPGAAEFEHLLAQTLVPDSAVIAAAEACVFPPPWAVLCSPLAALRPSPERRGRSFVPPPHAEQSVAQSAERGRR